MQDTGAICLPDSVPQELCFLPGDQIQDVVERLERLVLPSGYDLLLLVHAGSRDTARVTLCMSRMTPELWWQWGGLLAPSGEGERLRHGRQMLANSWCHSGALGFVIPGTFEGKGLTG